MDKNVSNVGIIGAGTMGQGLSQCIASFGYNVTLIDINKDILTTAKESIYNNLRFHNMVNKSEVKEDIDIIMSRVNFTDNYDLLSNANIIIENANENWGIKEDIYKKLDKVCPEDSIFLVNTSCISITKIAALTNRKENIIGVHFMNPVPMIKGIEVIKGYHTSENTISSVINFLTSIGKDSIIVNDFPGFVSNRLSHLFMNEAAFVVQDQVASPNQVDDIFKKCYGHKMGPLETADLIGLDTVVDSLKVLYDSFQDPKFRCCPLLSKMVNAGLLGRKSGQGFYKY